MGDLATGTTQYEYEIGPDGRRYAVGGEVQINTSPEQDPEATIEKAQRIIAAASAPAGPSPEDRAVAAKASPCSTPASERGTSLLFSVQRHAD